MSIKLINKTDFQQKFDVLKEDKLAYGEIYTPFSLIEDMFAMFPPTTFTNHKTKWLDPGAGTGFFSIYLYWKLMEGLVDSIPDVNARQDHIIQNMIYMIDIKPTNTQTLYALFGEKANIVCGDFISSGISVGAIQFDYIIGNPPYNSQGMKKVPTNKDRNKKEDGKTIWFSFIKQAISLLKCSGHLLFIVPSIWMKPDKANVYHFLTHYNIIKLKCLTNTETNKYFNGEAQTPTCYFLLENIKSINPISQLALYDKDRQEYIDYNLNVERNQPIPVFGSAIVMKMLPFIKCAGCIKVIKTNMPSKNTKLSPEINTQHPHLNIKTCRLNRLDKTTPEIIVEYSSDTLAYSGIKKLVLAHKMYGLPCFDKEGTYGISNRDNYVIINNNYTDTDFIKLRDFLSTKLALYLFETTRYRMKYLEKYAFELIPDIIKLSKIDADALFPRVINDETLADYFGLDTLDRENIAKLHKKHYNKCEF
jgi:hypothetical protein